LEVVAVLVVGVVEVVVVVVLFPAHSQRKGKRPTKGGLRVSVCCDRTVRFVGMSVVVNDHTGVCQTTNQFKH